MLYYFYCNHRQAPIDGWGGGGGGGGGGGEKYICTKFMFPCTHALNTFGNPIQKA